MLPPGYDDKGNLYMEAWRGHSNNVCELPHDGSKIKGPISTGTLVLGNYGTVMWDGKYITLAEQEDYNTANSAVIYQMKEDASGGLTEVGETVLSQNCNVDVIQPFIVGTKNTPDNHTQGTTVVGTNTHCGEYETVFYWAYPSGGNPTNAFAPGAAGFRKHRSLGSSCALCTVSQMRGRVSFAQLRAPFSRPLDPSLFVLAPAFR